MIYGLYTKAPLGVVSPEQMYFEGRGVHDTEKYGSIASIIVGIRDFVGTTRAIHSTTKRQFPPS
jgi:hypothetical protein